MRVTFDVPIAIGVLVATGQLPAHAAERLLLVGELGLDGRTRPVPGVLQAALVEQGFDAADQAAANALLDQVKYEKTVQWLGKDPYLIQQAEGVFDVNTVFAGVLVLTACALVLDYAVTLAERRLLRWRPGRVSTNAS